MTTRTETSSSMACLQSTVDKPLGMTELRYLKVLTLWTCIVVFASKASVTYADTPDDCGETFWPQFGSGFAEKNVTLNTTEYHKYMAMLSIDPSLPIFRGRKRRSTGNGVHDNLASPY